MFTSSIRGVEAAQMAFTPSRERPRESRLHLNGIGQHLSYASARTPSPRVIRSSRGVRQKRV